MVGGILCNCVMRQFSVGARKAIVAAASSLSCRLTVAERSSSLRKRSVGGYRDGKDLYMSWAGPANG
jgi:hypothetical protein